MKNLVYSSLLIALLFVSSCSKKDDVDPRDQYVGTYKCTQTMIIASIGYNETETFTQVITKSTTNSNQILFHNPEDYTDTWPANVNGNSYTYEEMKDVDDDGSIFTQTGSGSINGNVITEQGTSKVSYPNGQVLSGTWSNIMNKQ